MDEQDDDAPTAPFWMVTYSDMVTLLLTFFVLIVSMSELKVQKFYEALSYFQGRTSVLSYDAIIQPITKQAAIEFTSYEQAERFEELQRYLHENDMHDKVQVNLSEKGLEVTITDSVMFQSGRAELIEPSRTILMLLGNILDDSIEAVIVEGHTDDRPISTSLYPSNWELASARAAAVVRFLQSGSHLDPSRYVAVGFGEHRPIGTNETPVGRARNRRVEILLSWEPWQNQNSNTNPPETKTGL
jgi:chemotaxis protein MotB